MTSIDIPYSLRREIAAYCSHAISPQRYYLHNAIGGEHWSVKHNPATMANNASGNWCLECSVEHAIIIRLKYGV